jgi:hypothetical protein
MAVAGEHDLIAGFSAAHQFGQLALGFGDRNPHAYPLDYLTAVIFEEMVYVKVAWTFWNLRADHAARSRGCVC